MDELSLLMIGEYEMDSRQAGIFRLLIIAIFFCMSIFFLNNNKKNTLATYIDIGSTKTDFVTNLSAQQAYHAMNSLFSLRDIDLIVKAMGQFKCSFAHEIMQKIIEDEVMPLSVAEKACLIYGMVVHSCQRKHMQYEWLDLFLEYPELNAQSSPLLILARSKYADTIALFIAWGKDRQKLHNKVGLLAGYAEQAFEQAVRDNDYAAVETLFSKKVRIAQNKASELLWYIIQADKRSELVSLLVNHAQADVNYAVNGKALLIAAVEKNNIDIVRILLDKGAVVDRCIDGEKSTALTIATKNKHHSVEQLLREYGA